ncbi:MAG: type II toxin-antitoxin system PemK/MazF family toxin [Clostridia bacterium]|nr:type II toxin-antitoxin system PemK/MazF family toxin [Clostridia bacterium]
MIALPSHDPRGHEQEGVRPAVVVSVPQGYVRYPVVIVVPLTTRSGDWARRDPSLYLPLPAGAGGLPRPSVALVDQVRAVDVKRVRGYLGTLGEMDFKLIKNSLLRLLGGEPS